MCIWAYASGRPLGDRPGLTDNEQQMRQMINMIFPKWVDRVGEPSVFDTLCFLMNGVKALDLDHLQVEMGFDMPRVLCSLMIVAFRHAQTLAFGDRQARVRLRRYDCFGGRSVLVFVLECVFFKKTCFLIVVGSLGVRYLRRQLHMAGLRSRWPGDGRHDIGAFRRH